MPWNLTYHAQKPAEAKIGDCWPAPEFLGRKRQDGQPILGQNYFNDWAASRQPLVVALPAVYADAAPEYRCSVQFFCLDAKASGESHGNGWKVSIEGDLVDGQQPKITVSPSINCVGSYHGVITDDCEGRKYTPKG